MTTDRFERTLGVDPRWVYERLAEEGVLDRIYPDDEQRRRIEVMQIAKKIAILEGLGKQEEIPSFLRR